MHIGPIHAVTFLLVSASLCMVHAVIIAVSSSEATDLLNLENTVSFGYPKPQALIIFLPTQWLRQLAPVPI